MVGDPLVGAATRPDFDPLELRTSDALATGASEKGSSVR